jgi:hypothetical protein
MGMMSGGTYGDMGRGQHMQGGGSLIGAAPADSGDAFAGVAGMQRCRAMMGTMAGMHRSMQSMMGGRMGEEGRMKGRMGSMHEQMGAMREMDPEQMRRLCHTMEGATFSYTFDDPGEYRYECTPHAGIGMRGPIIVAGEG